MSSTLTVSLVGLFTTLAGILIGLLWLFEVVSGAIQLLEEAAQRRKA